MMNQTEIKTLLKKYISDNLSKEEYLRLAFLIKENNLQPQFESAIEELFLEDTTINTAKDKDTFFEKIMEEAERRQDRQRLQFVKYNRIPLKRYAVYAAACIVCIVAGFYLLWSKKGNSNNSIVINKQVIAKDNEHKTTLTLANGTTIVLDTILKGNVTGYSNVKVVKLDDNQLVYDSKDAKRSDSLSFNTLKVPRGQLYQLQLSDGTKVWLNSATSLRFPVAFGNASRQVELDGEAYFEVAKDPSKPFIVSAGNMEVSVLGTHFNVMAYKDEGDIRTTLIEGSVKLKSSNKEILIKPGQQGIFNNSSTYFSVVNTNVDVALAWKNGEFNFQNTDIRTIMRQITRWYDVSVSYAGTVPGVELSGIISKKEKVNQLLEILEATNKVSFSLDENKITVFSKTK